MKCKHCGAEIIRLQTMGRPDVCTKCNNAFDGEPCDPVNRDFDFIPFRDIW